jgi:CO/xanthine dehydrogenase Mo-binding subunit
LQNGHVYAGEHSLTYGAVVSAFFGMPGGELIGRGYSRPGVGFSSQFPLFWETGMGAAEVRVDRETGEMRVEHYVTVADVGKAINPLQAEAQDEGAAVQGFGHTFFEALQYENGQPLNANLIDYCVPRFTDLPRRFESLLIENEDGPGPYGAKGMGESGIVSVAPAIGNALAQATGARVRELPLTPERVWRALQDLEGREDNTRGDR